MSRRRLARTCEGFVDSPSLTATGIGYRHETFSQQVVLRRRTAAGALLGDVRLPGALDVDQDGATVVFVRFVRKTETTPERFEIVRLS